MIELAGSKSRSIAAQGKLIFCRTPAEPKPGLLKKNLFIHGGANIEENQRIELSPAHCPLRRTSLYSLWLMPTSTTIINTTKVKFLR